MIFLWLMAHYPNCTISAQIPETQIPENLYFRTCWKYLRQWFIIVMGKVVKQGKTKLVKKENHINV